MSLLADEDSLGVDDDDDDVTPDDNVTPGD